MDCIDCSNCVIAGGAIACSRGVWTREGEEVKFASPAEFDEQPAAVFRRMAEICPHGDCEDDD